MGTNLIVVATHLANAGSYHYFPPNSCQQEISKASIDNSCPSPFSAFPLWKDIRRQGKVDINHRSLKIHQFLDSLSLSSCRNEPVRNVTIRRRFGSI